MSKDNYQPQNIDNVFGPLSHQQAIDFANAVLYALSEQKGPRPTAAELRSRQDLLAHFERRKMGMVSVGSYDIVRDYQQVDRMVSRLYWEVQRYKVALNEALGEEYY